jgi:hypothetical protein
LLRPCGPRNDRGAEGGTFGNDMRRFLAMLTGLCVLALTGCAPPAAPVAEAPLVLVTLDPHATATATPFQPAPATDTVVPSESPTEVPTLTDTATSEPPSPTLENSVTAAPTNAPPPPTSVPASSRTQYTLYVTLDYAGHGGAVNESIGYTNNTGQSLSTVVLAVEPNLWTNCFSLDQLQQDGTAVADYTLNGQRLTISLAQPLAPAATTSFSLGYRLSLPWKPLDGTFGYRSNQLNLTDWYPFIVPYVSGWLLHDPWTFGEHLVYDAADFDVSVKANKADVVLAASAPGEVSGGVTHYHLDAARTFILSASDSYKVDDSAVGTVKIEAYYFAGHEDANKAVVWMATQSLGLYEAKFGPYPYQSLSIVETDVADGQEYDGLVFLASRFYSDYNGKAKSNLFTIGTHEIAHQWWFGLVGDDQATEPWLDEAMAVYSERIFYEYNYPGYGDWWWNFRVNYFGPSGYVDSSVYSFSTFRAYVNAVYLNGAKFLEDLRMRIGDEAFFAFLKDYASTYAHGHVTTYDFFAMVRQHTDRDFSDIEQAYFQGRY